MGCGVAGRCRLLCREWQRADGSDAGCVFYLVLVANDGGGMLAMQGVSGGRAGIIEPLVPDGEGAGVSSEDVVNLPGHLHVPRACEGLGRGL